MCDGEWAIDIHSMAKHSNDHPEDSSEFDRPNITHYRKQRLLIWQSMVNYFSVIWNRFMADTSFSDLVRLWTHCQLHYTKHCACLSYRPVKTAFNHVLCQSTAIETYLLLSRFDLERTIPTINAFSVRKLIALSDY